MSNRYRSSRDFGKERGGIIRELRRSLGGLGRGGLPGERDLTGGHHIGSCAQLIAMDLVPCTEDRMFEADRHLDRLGDILRDLRAPPDRVHASTAAAETAAEAAAEAAAAAETAAEAAAEAAVVQRKQAQALEQGGLYVSRGSPSWGAHVASQSSKGEMPRHRQRLATSNQALNATTQDDPPTKREAVPRRDNARVRAKSPPMKLRFDATPRIENVPRAPSGGVAVRHRSVEATRGATTRVQKSTLRERAIRVWWRGLSCGVCFAAGAWARDGHGIFGVLLALAAVCGELVLHER